MKRLALIGVLLVPQQASAQQSQNVQDVIARTEAAINDLDYGRAAIMARSLLELANERDPSIEIRGLQLLSAALYPEERSLQRPDSARANLRRLIWATPSAIIPRSISWPGLDSLLEETRRNTLALWAQPESIYTVTGTTARIPILVRGSRPVAFSAVAIPEYGAPIFLDSISTSTGGRLSLPLFDGDRPRLLTGKYELRLIATDTINGESAARRYEMSVDASAFSLDPVPLSFPSDSLLPEVSRRRPMRNALLGVALGAVTGLIANTMQGDEGVGPSSKDNRAYIVAGTMSLGGILGALTDRGRPQPQHVQRNQELRAERDLQIRVVEQENARRRGAFSAVVRIGRELR